MIRHAQAELPNECCGLLAGVRDQDAWRVFAIHPLVNELESATVYHSEPRSMFEASKAMREAGHEILAVYHSHPTSEPIPSRTDLARQYIPGLMQVIIGLHGPTPTVRAWWLEETTFAEAAWTIVEL